MKKYIIAFFSTMAVIGMLHLIVVVSLHGEQEKRECLNSISNSFSSTPNSINHLGVLVEITCLQWSK